MALYLDDFLRLRDIIGKIRIVRHRDKRYDLDRLYATGEFEIYQATQTNPVFGDAEYILSFMGLAHMQARLIGLYRVLGCRRVRDLPERPTPSFEELTDDVFWYDLERDPRLDDLEGRIVICWGPPPLARTWVQDDLHKEITQVLPEGYVRPFPGYQEVILSYAELVDIVGHPDTNREWHDKLGAVAGVYLIVDTRTGMQYVGSASGRQGIWGRWVEYAQTGHGGNQRLIALLEKDPLYVHNLQLSILQTLSHALAPRQVIEFEGIYKKKLGSCAFGLNSI